MRPAGAFVACVFLALAGVASAQKVVSPPEIAPPPLPSQPPSPGAGVSESGKKQTAPENSPQNTDQDKRGTENSPLTVKLLNTGKSDPEAAQEAQRIKEQTARERWATNWTIGLTAALVFAAFLQFSGLVGQIIVYRKQAGLMQKALSATTKAADAARDSADVLPAIERPYVLVIGGGFLAVSRQVTQDPRPIVAYRCGNFGKTPAIIENLRAGFSRNSNGHPDPPNRVEDTHALLLAPILKGGEEISPLWVFCPDDWITGDVAVNRGESMLLVRQPATTEGEELFLWIIVNYRGAFTKGHETSACWKFNFSEHMFLHYGGDEYNYER